MKGRAQYGFSLWEFGLSSILLGILATVLLGRLLYYQDVAERAQLDLTLRTLQGALRIRMSEMLIDGRAHRWGELVGGNPFDWLERPPGNYCGEHRPDSAFIKGCWLFDPRAQEILYRPRGIPRPLQGSDEIIRYAVVARAETRNESGSTGWVESVELVRK